MKKLFIVGLMLASTPALATELTSPTNVRTALTDLYSGLGGSFSGDVANDYITLLRAVDGVRAHDQNASNITSAASDFVTQLKDDLTLVSNVNGTKKYISDVRFVNGSDVDYNAVGDDHYYMTTDGKNFAPGAYTNDCGSDHDGTTSGCYNATFRQNDANYGLVTNKIMEVLGAVNETNYRYHVSVGTEDHGTSGDYSVLDASASATAAISTFNANKTVVNNALDQIDDITDINWNSTAFELLGNNVSSNTAKGANIPHSATQSFDTYQDWFDNDTSNLTTRTVQRRTYQVSNGFWTRGIVLPGGIPASVTAAPLSDKWGPLGVTLSHNGSTFSVAAVTMNSNRDVTLWRIYNGTSTSGHIWATDTRNEAGFAAAVNEILGRFGLARSAE